PPPASAARRRTPPPRSAPPGSEPPPTGPAAATPPGPEPAAPRPPEPPLAALSVAPGFPVGRSRARLGASEGMRPSDFLIGSKGLDPGCEPPKQARMKAKPVHVIGGGLAGSEAAWQIASQGVPVVLH